MTLQERSPHGKCRIVNNMSEETNKKEQIKGPKKKPKYPLAVLVVLPAIALCISCIAAGASFLVNQKLDSVSQMTQRLNSMTIPGVETGESATAESAASTPVNTVLHDDVNMNTIGVTVKNRTRMRNIQTRTSTIPIFPTNLFIAHPPYQYSTSSLERFATSCRYVKKSIMTKRTILIALALPSLPFRIPVK